MPPGFRREGKSCFGCRLCCARGMHRRAGTGRMRLQRPGACGHAPWLLEFQPWPKQNRYCLVKRQLNHRD
jgi:hypothetical protein